MNKKRCVRTIFLYSMKIKKMNTMRKNIESFQSAVSYTHLDVDELKEKVKAAIVRLNVQSQSDGVLVLTDLFGGSPSNVTARSLHELGNSVKVECVTGVNLPMLLLSLIHISFSMQVFL